LGLSETDISKLGLVALKLRDDQSPVPKSLDFSLKEIPLPDGAKTITEWAQGHVPDDMIEAVTYLLDRGIDLEWYDFMWTPMKGFSDRIIIPFRSDGKIVGSTARKITGGKPKYLTTSQPGYVFNLDGQTWDKRYVIVVEGQFDAIAIEGVAIGHNDPNEVQCARINSLGREVIVVPDRDRPGAKMLEAALDNRWSVSLPPWGDDIKDVADAVKAYGRLYTLATILHYRETNEIKIQLLKKKLESLDEQA
jgi:DNA primase